MIERSHTLTIINHFGDYFSHLFQISKSDLIYKVWQMGFELELLLKGVLQQQPSQDSQQKRL